MSSIRPALLGAGLCLSLWGAAGWPAQPPVPVPIKNAPSELTDAIVRADAVFDSLKARLQKELTAAVRKGGYEGAIDVCHEAAAAITHEVGLARGIAVGRTSDRVRCPTNEPKAWAAPIVRQFAGARADQAGGFVVDLGDRVGVMRPITTEPVCVGCHGPREKFGAAVKAVLKERYPADRAVGFEAGDLRGWMWAEVPK